MATGEGLPVVAQYDANPGGTLNFSASGAYFEVYTAPGNTFSQVGIVACGMTTRDKLYWWDAGTKKWAKARPQSYDQGTGCVTLTVTEASSSSLSQLQGTYFASGTEPNTAPNAQFKGSGTVNGGLDPNGNAYKFMLWAGDGFPDTFRIRIWWEVAGGAENIVDDNGFNQTLADGSIVVHTGK